MGVHDRITSGICRGGGAGVGGRGMRGRLGAGELRRHGGVRRLRAARSHPDAATDAGACPRSGPKPRPGAGTCADADTCAHAISDARSDTVSDAYACAYARSNTQAHADANTHTDTPAVTLSEAGGALGISAWTVASHVKAIYRKLNIASRAEAALDSTGWHSFTRCVTNARSPNRMEPTSFGRR